MLDKKKVLVLGFDAGTLDIIRPLAAQGRLPNFTRMMKEGTFGELTSTLPPVTPPAWASFMTGKNPGKHGVYNFYFHSSNPSRDDENYFVNYNSIKANTIWEILSAKRRKSVVINVPVTYPVTPHIDGVLISGLLTPNNAQDFVTPIALKDEMARDVGPYRVDSHPNTEWSGMTLKERLDYYIESEEKRTEAALYLMKTRPWDFFMVMYGFTDKVLHIVYPHVNRDYPESIELKDYIRKTYEKADEFLGRLLDCAGRDAVVFIVSDHGFGHMEKAFHSNKWLVDNGFMALKKTTLRNVRELYHLKARRVSVGKLLTKMRLDPLRYVLPGPVKEMSFSLPRAYKKVSRHVVDWTRTRAYAGDYGIRINLKGRETTGIVEQGKEYESLRDEITERLYELRDPETGEKLVDRVWKREEIYSGPHSAASTDLIYIMKGISYVQYDSYYFKTLFKRYENGMHRMNGIFFVKGDGVKKGHEIKGAHITDVAPTILHSMGEAVPDDMDGAVLIGAFEDGAAPPSMEPPLPFLRGDSDDRAVYSAEEEDEIKEGLKGLGYWG